MNDSKFQELRARVYDKVRSLSLSQFIEFELNITGRASGKTMRYSTCVHCGEGPKDSVRFAVLPDDAHYKCHRCGRHGDILEAAMELWGKSNWECALILSGESQERPAPNLALRQVRPPEEIEKAAAEKAASLRDALIKIQKITESYKDEEACLDYLVIERGLPIELVREAQRRKMLGFLPNDPKLARKLVLEAVSQEQLIASGLWKEGKKSSAIFFRPCVFFMPGAHSAEFRILGEPSEDNVKSIRYGIARYPYVWRAAQPSTRGMVVEGFIDMLSAVALGYQHHVVGLPGCNNWDIEQIKEVGSVLNISHWVVAFDNDSEEQDDEESIASGVLKNPGETWANRLQQALNEHHLPNVRHAPPVGVDINKLLQLRRAA
jgi:hypothetical protein